MSTFYDAGPRLSESIEGDRYRQAVAALGGYAYQLVASAHAWLDLRDSEILYVEVAEDYATALHDALAATQVKATTTSITLLSPSVAQAIDSLVDLTVRNPDRAVTLHLLTTASIGEERNTDDRPSGVAGLKYWRRAAGGADVTPLRRVLLGNTHLSERVKTFVDSRDDQALRTDLLRRIHWDTEQPDLPSLRTELEERLTDRGIHKHGLSRDACRQLVGLVLGHLLEIGSAKESARRALTQAHLDQLIDVATRVSIRPRDLDAMLAALTSTGGDQQPLRSDTASSFLRREAEVPMPTGLSQRAAVVADLAARALRHESVIVVGGTGTGKTTLARLAARLLSGDWVICHLAEAAPDIVAERVSRLLVHLGHVTVRGVILDDLTGFDAPATQEAVARLLAALRRRNQLCLITAYREPSPRVLAGSFMLASEAIAHTPYFDVDETSEVIVGAGGDSTLWASAVHNGSSHGHPQLTHAVVAGLAARSWPPAERAALLEAIPSTIDIDAERGSIRRRLLDAVPESARALLYRTSLVLGPFSRHVAIALGQVDPRIDRPSEALEQLVGPWIDAIGRSWFRASPLVGHAGRELLDSDEQQRIHRTIAEQTLASPQLDPILVNVAFSHALIAESHQSLLKIAHSIVFAAESDLEMISDWIVTLRNQPTDRPIFPKSLPLSNLLRLAQVLILGPRASDEVIATAVTALFAEVAKEPDPVQRDRFFYIATTKLFFKQTLHGRIPQWFERLLQLRDIGSRNPQIANHQRTLEQAHPEQPGLLEALFTFQAMGLRTIAELSALFDALDVLTEDMRNEILSVPFARRHGLLFIDAAWMREHRCGTINGVDGAQRFLRMAQQAERWRQQELALRCHVARGIMLDEYQERSDAALAALDEAAQKWGDDPLLTRARAKIFYRRKDHFAALELISSVAGSLALENRVEKVFMLREAAISAAEIGEWGRARKWYAAAHDVADASLVPAMRPMTIGLLADLAVAEFKDDDAPAAIRRLGAALIALSNLDASASLQAYYCHSIVRHAILWCLAQVSREKMLVDGEVPQMRPGWCSNPEPSEAIRTKPLAALEVGWYLLARMDLLTGGQSGIAKDLATHLRGRHIAQLEIMFAQDRMESAIILADPERFGACLRPWVDARIYFKNNASGMWTSAMESPIHTPIPAASREDLCASDTSEAIERAVLAFALSAAFKERIDLLEHLRAHLVDDALVDSIQGRVRQVLDALAGEGEQSVGTAAITRSVAASDVEPDGLFVATVRLLEFVRGSMFAAVLAPMLARWARQSWQNAIKNQRFHLRAPVATVPAIEATLDASGEDLGTVARIVLAAEPAVRQRLSPELRAQLMEMQ